MTGTQEQSRSDDANISSPPDIAAVALLPQTERASPSREPTSRGHQPETTVGAATLKFASESHEYIREYIRNADQKAIFYFSICSALLAFEHTQAWSQRWLKPPSLWSAADLVTCIAMIGLAAAAACFLWVVMPRLGGSPRGLIFFKSVAAYPSAEEYVSEIAKQSEADLTSEKLRHCHELAKVASSKYWTLGIGLRIGAIGILCSLLLLLAGTPPDGSGKSSLRPPAQTQQTSPPNASNPH